MISVPTIHLNGTSREDLLKPLRNAAEAVHDAEKALRECYPNGRDYYVQSPDTIHRALDEHENRLRRLHAIYEELTEIWRGVNDQ